MRIIDILSKDSISTLKRVKNIVTKAADKAGDIAGYVGESITGKPAKIIDKKVENTTKEFLDNVGYCISDVHIENVMKGVLDDAAYAVSELKLDELVKDGVEDLYDFAGDIDNFFAENHLPPTPCCFVIGNICERLKNKKSDSEQINTG